MAALNPPQIQGLNSVYLPAAASASERAKEKLLIVLHGLGDSVEGYRFLPEFLGLPKLSYLLLNAPDAYYIGYSWFQIPGDSAPGIIRSRRLLQELYRQLLAQGYRSENIGIFGFSQGALLTMDFILRAEQSLACAVAISGFVFFLEEYPNALSAAVKNQKIFVSHGDHDPLLPLEPSKSAIQSLQAMGVPIEWREYHKDHTIDAQEERRDLHFFLKKCFSL